MKLFETIQNLNEAKATLTKLRNDPQAICDEFDIEADDLPVIEEELVKRIRAIENNDIMGFCESKLEVINYNNQRIFGIQTEITRLQEILSFATKQADKAKQSIDWLLKVTGTEKLETKFNNLSYRKSEAVVIDDEDKIPENFKNEKIMVSIDKIELKKFLKGGNSIEGARIETRQNLQIK